MTIVDSRLNLPDVQSRQSPSFDSETFKVGRRVKRSAFHDVGKPERLHYLTHIAQ